MRTNLRNSASLAFATMLAIATGGGAANAEPVKIRAAWIATPASLIPILFAKPGLAKHQGVTYQFEELHFQGTPPEVTALAAGEIEIATLNFATLPIAIENAGLTDIRVIADETQDGVGDYATVQYQVLKDSPFKKPEDLKGKIVAVNAVGTGVDIGLRTLMSKHGLQAGRDYTVIEVPFPSMKAVLVDHKTDLMTSALPFNLLPDWVEAARTLFTLKQAMGGTELSVWEVREPFLQKNRAALVDLLEDMVRSYRWYADPANHKEAVAILAAYTKQPAERLDWAFTKTDAFRDPNGLPNLPMLQSNVNAVKALGIVKTDLDVTKYADLSLVKEAALRLK
jgi:NitT/TauT family transport system substrate-binding protein